MERQKEGFSYASPINHDIIKQIFIIKLAKGKEWLEEIRELVANVTGNSADMA